MKGPITHTVLLLAATGLAVLGCTEGQPGPTGGSSSSTSLDGSVGTVRLALTLAPGMTLNAVNYRITGPNSFQRTGSIDVSQSSTVSAVIAGLPPGTGYSADLQGMTTDGATTCMGSSQSFDIVSRQTTAVTARLDCHEAPRTGTVALGATLNVCPVIDNLSALPAEVRATGSIALSAVAHDSDNGPSALQYQWTASGGTLANSTTPSPTFTCGSSTGTVTVTVTVSDGDPAASCADSVSTTVICTAG
jgi:hypothetical protein